MSLTVNNLVAHAGSFRVEIASLEIPRGTIHGLAGPSGSGKTTRLLAIAGFIPSTGEVAFEGKRLDALPPERRRIALGFQRASLFPRLDARDNVAFGLKMQGIAKPERHARAEEWLRKCGIGDLARRLPHELSEGQAQRVALARALAPAFPVVLLDEPFSSLDDVARIALRELLASLVKEARISALLVSHHADDMKSCDSVSNL